MNDGTINWKSLSAKDFERLCRDLFARLLGQAVEAFATGPDGGVDLRTNRGRTVIQCKRYTGSLSSLLRVLREEAQKPAVRRARRYMLAVTLPLTPAAKEKIMRALPALQNAADVFGADDLEGLLAQHRDLRALYPALWLGDADFLRTLIREAVGRGSDRRSQLEMEEIAEAMQSFVPPPQAEEAMHTLRESRALIITGEPGIGKTSLARHLIWQLCMGEGYEPVYIDRDIHEGLERFDEGKKQVFFYDDFLGSTLLREGMEAHKGRNVTAFIHKLRRHEGKLLILTSREYIFRQAGQLDEDFRPERAAFARYLLCMKPFSAAFKRELLCKLCRKHRIDPRRTARLLAGRKHPLIETEGEQILNHANFNPRLLDTALQQLRHAAGHRGLGCYLIAALDHPYDLYENAFLHTLTQAQRDYLLVLASLPEQADPEDVRRALRAYQGTPAEPTAHSLRVLVGDFLTTRLNRDGTMQTDFVNPGVRDFIYHYYAHDTETAQRLIDSAALPLQMFHLLKALSLTVPRGHHLKAYLMAHIFRYVQEGIAAGQVQEHQLALISFMCLSGTYLQREEQGAFIAEVFAAHLDHLGDAPFTMAPLYYEYVIKHIPRRYRDAIDWEKVIRIILQHGFCEARELYPVAAVRTRFLPPGEQLPHLAQSGYDWCRRYMATAHEWDADGLRREHHQMRHLADHLPDGFCGLHCRLLRDYLMLLRACHRHARRKKHALYLPPPPIDQLPPPPQERRTETESRRLTLHDG